jgi:eukaryotic-like serine/threonine-protein kinase
VPAASSTENNPSFAYAPGDLIASKYRLEQLIGEGGMGAVFRARNTSLDMLVAIKLLRADLNRALLAGRLMQEARAVAKLTHPGIVRVFDVGQTALGDPFIVMELLDGETLAALIDRQRGLTAIHAVQLLLPIADALSAAHAKGLVHRDVKPDNVLLVVSDEGIVQPKLLDFGIVKSAQADGSSDLSEAGSVVGSPDYMSPEQARGLAQVDSRSDLWSFSVVLYEAIAGVPPFQANNHDTLLRMIVQDEPKSLLTLGVANHALSYIVARGLSKNPLERYASLSQMGKALAAWLADQGVTEDACGVSLEAKWLARATDPHGLRRVSWPPPARNTEQASSSRSIDLTFVDGPAAQASANTLPPSSLTPVADSSVGDERPVRRSKLALVAAALLALPVAGLAFAGLRTERPALAAAASSVPERVAGSGLFPPASAAIASTATPVAPIASDSAPASSPPAAGSAETPVSRVSRQPKPSPARRRPAPVKPQGTGPRPTAARPSDMLAPMPF